MIDAKTALQRLAEGNRRFISGRGGRDLDFEHARRRELVAEQAPFAVVLGCSDSRVPLELIFDQGLGDLFVVRVAGNVAAPSQLGSIEFAVERFGTPLVVVLGHSQCGAVSAAVEHALDPTGEASPNLAAIAERILPAVQAVVETNPQGDPEELVAAAVPANVRDVLGRIVADSPLLAEKVRDGSLTLAGAEYALETGAVRFLD